MQFVQGMLYNPILWPQTLPLMKRNLFEVLCCVFAFAPHKSCGVFHCLARKPRARLHAQTVTSFTSRQANDVPPLTLDPI